MSGQGVHTAVAAVMKAMSEEGISKGKVNQQQGFAYRGIDDVMSALSPQLVAAGLLITPTTMKRSAEERISASGKKSYVVALEVNYTLTAVSDGSTMQCTVFGEAMDQADKATNKAMSVAYKYLCIQVFCIPIESTSETDPDAEQEPTGPMPEHRIRFHSQQITDTRTIPALNAAKNAAKAECARYGANSEYEALKLRALNHAKWINAQPTQPPAA